MIPNETYYLKKEHVNKHGTVFYTEIFKLTCEFDYHLTEADSIMHEKILLDYIITKKQKQNRVRRIIVFYSWYTSDYWIMHHCNSLYQLYNVLLPYKHKNNIRLTIVPYSEIEVDVALKNL